MKDSNEYGRNVKAKSKTDKTLRLGKVTLIFGAGGSLTDENIDTFLHDILTRIDIPILHVGWRSR